jgi:succinoglycan biosynthesis protein ExoU
MTAPSDDSVCICIAALNAASTVARAVSSALAQTKVTEVILVDDGSTDGTADIARRCDDGSGRLKVISLERNGGPSVARNAALQHSRAAIFSVLDADDYLLPGRIERLLATEGDEWDFLADDILIVPEALAGTAPADAPEATVPKAHKLDAATFILSNVSHPRRPRAELGFLKPLIRRRFLDEHGLRYDPALRLGEDYALYVSALVAGARFNIAGFCGYIAIERANSLSSSHSAAHLAAIAAFDEAFGVKAGLSSEVRHALAAHRTATLKKWAMARALEIRRSDGMAGGLRFLARRPWSLPYVFAQALRARSTGLRRRIGSPETISIRPLIGEKAIGAR